MYQPPGPTPVGSGASGRKVPSAKPIFKPQGPMDPPSGDDDGSGNTSDSSSSSNNGGDDGGPCDDYDADGICDDEDVDDDNDGVEDSDDSDSNNPFICSDIDLDSCDDCSSGVYDPVNDGEDLDADGVCDLSWYCASQIIY